MTTIYLIRHAEAEGNLYRIAHGHYNSCITDDRGCRQIRALAERFRDVPVDAVYASDLIRTRTTAQSIYLPKGLQLHPDPAFREICMGEWEEHCWYELLRKYPQSHDDFNHRLDRWQVPGSETARQVLDRYLPALRRVARQHDGQTVAIFSHGAAMRIVLGTLQGLSLLEIGDTPFGDNTSVARLEAEGDDIRVLYRDDNSHLVQAGLSTLAKQKWWRQKGVQEMGQLYAPLTEEERQQMGVPTGGEGVAVRFVDELIGAYQLLPRPEEGVGEIGWYGLLPQWQGRDQGIQPPGQIIQRCRHMGAKPSKPCHGDPCLIQLFLDLLGMPFPQGFLQLFPGHCIIHCHPPPTKFTISITSLSVRQVVS